MIEEGAKVAGSIVDALKTSPVTLAILVINCAIVGFLFFSEVQQAKRADSVHSIVERMFQACLQRRNSGGPVSPGGV